MKKAIGQTVRDLKREVNKKVLKVPSIEQKVLDVTSNEPWGPHGTLLAEIAQASRNYHEYQMIMSVIWKRINDTGKNWRHVYKALTVLDYLVGHGSERVIDEIREHAYQIQTLSDFQYIDSSGRDQGNNVRTKSQSLVVLVNDKDRIQEVRQKATSNREKYRNTSAGGMYRPGSSPGGGGYNDDRYDGRYGSRDEDRNGYGRGSEWGSRDDDRNGRYGDSYGRDGDRYNRDDDRYGRDGYRDDDYRGRSGSIDDYQYGSRSRSSDRDRYRSYEDDGQYSSRGNGAKLDDQSQDGSYGGRNLDRKYSEQNLGAPPSYEEAVSAGRSPTYSERDGETPSGSAPKSSSPPATVSLSESANTFPSQPAAASPPPSVSDKKEVDGFDEFDPRGSFSATPTASYVADPTTPGSVAPTTTGSAEMDLLGSLSESFSNNSLALVPTTTYPPSAEDVQTFDDPFGDGPFKAVAATGDFSTQQCVTSTAFDATSNPPQFVSQKTKSVSTFGETSYVASGVHPSAASPQYSTQGPSPLQDIDVLADILPLTVPQLNANSETLYTAPNGQPSMETGFPPQSNPTPAQIGFPSQNSSVQANLPIQPGQVGSPTSFPSQPGQPPMQTSFNVQSGQHMHLAQTAQNGQPLSVAGFSSQMGPQASFVSQSVPQNSSFYGGYNQQMVSAAPVVPQMASSVGLTAQQNPGSFFSPTSSVAPSSPLRSNSPSASQSMVSVSTGALTLAPQPAKDKFETKSTVWADTLSRGLVNLNISGPKTNPLADIGVDFDAINRKEKRLEKPSNTPVVSNVSMGKAMGSGTGIGRAGAGARRPAPNQMIGSGMPMGVGGGPGQGMGGYPSVNQPMGGLGMNMAPNMGMGMNMGMGQTGQMQRPMGFPPGSTTPGGYNPMMGMGNYGQQPYGGGYR